MLLKLIIVDDEPIILQGMAETFDWNSIGFQVVGTALNGEDALKLIEEEMPDVVLTDIRMKKMDGITLMERTKAVSRDVRFVVLSAYKDFEYAQRACDLGAMAYILKPVNDDMMDSMKRVHDQCATEKEKHAMVEQWQRFVEGNRSGFELYLIEHYLTGEVSLEEIRSNYGVFTDAQIESDHYAVLCVDADVEYRLRNLSEFSAKRFALFSCMEERLKAGFDVWSFNNKDDARIYIVGLGSVCEPTGLRGITDSVRLELGYEIFFALTKAYQGFEGMKQAYFECLELYDLQCELDADMDGSEIDVETPRPRYPYEREKQVLSAVTRNDEAQLDEALNSFFASLGASEGVDKVYLHQLTVQVELLLRETYGMNDAVQPMFQELYSLMPRLLPSRLSHLCREVFQIAVDERKHHVPQGDERFYNEYVDAACAFIDDHLDEEGLSIVRVAQEVHLNAVYFGRVFKSVKNMSFKQYLLQRKLRRAKELLLTTNESIMDISWRVGITNPSYFTKLFKQEEGVLPSAYRESRAK